MKRTPTHSKVYFRIRTALVRYVDDFDGGGHSFNSEQDRERFYKGVCGTFTSCGWEVVPEEFSHSCPTVQKDESNLYLYPTYFSGIIKESLIREVEELLANAATFQHENTDIVERYVEMPDDEYLAFLESQKFVFERIILEVYTPVRSNLCFPGRHNASDKCQEHERDALGFEKLIQKHNKVCLGKFCDEIFDQLVRQGRIIKCNSPRGIAYRAVKPTHPPRKPEQPQNYGLLELGFALEPTPQGTIQ